jgi:hypothetical protein
MRNSLLKKHLSLLSLPALIIAALLLFACKKTDDVAPVVQLIGEANITIPLNGSYTEPGATATDNTDGTLEISISGTVNTDLEGTYILDYFAVDAAGNSGSARRYVHVVNEAKYLAGFYRARAYFETDTLLYSAEITTSTTLNRMIWIRGFALDSTAAVTAAILTDSISIAMQQGANPAQHYFWGKGNIVISADSLHINITGGDSLSGVMRVGQMKYSGPVN